MPETIISVTVGICVLLSVLVTYGLTSRLRSKKRRALNSPQIRPSTFESSDRQMLQSVDYPSRTSDTINQLDEVRESTNNLQSLIDKYTEKLAELETQISDVKRKLNVVTQASRLLEEEGLLEKQSSYTVGDL